VKRAGARHFAFGQVKAGREEHRGVRLEEPQRVVPLREFNKQIILQTLRQMNGDKVMAAQALGIGKTTLNRKLKQYESSGTS